MLCCTCFSIKKTTSSAENLLILPNHSFIENVNGLCLLFAISNSPATVDIYYILIPPVTFLLTPIILLIFYLT